MVQKKIYRHVVKVEVLTDTPEDLSGMTLAQIDHEITDGDWSGVFSVTKSNQELSGLKAVEAVKEQGSSPEFFQMDEKGNELE